MRASTKKIIVALLVLAAVNEAHTRVYYGFNSESRASITGSDIILEQGTSGASTVYMNATSASLLVDSHSTTFYPNDYNVTHGAYVSGTTPSSVNQIDSNYFIADAAGSDTSSLQYFPTSYSLSGGTIIVSGSLSNLNETDGIDMIFRSYPWNITQEDYVDVNTSNVDSVPSIGSQSNFTAQQYGPDTEFDTLMEYGWWDSNYHYCRNINVTTGSNTPYNGYDGYTVQFTIDTQSLISAGKMQSSGNDLRIVYMSGSDWEEIDRHIIDINTATTKVMFKLRKNISASSFDDDYYLYYSNIAAGSGPANLSNVYIWYDDASTDREAQYTQGRLDETAHGGSWRNSISWNPGGYYSYDTNDNYADSLRPTGLTERDVYVEYEEYNSNAYTTDMTSGPILRWVGTGSGGTETSSHWYYYEMANSAYLPGSYASHDDITADNRGTVIIAYGLLGTFPQLSYTKMGLAAWGVNPTNLKAWYDASPTQSESGSFGISGRFSGTHAAASDNEGAGQVGIWLQQDAGRVRNLLIRRYVEPEPSLIVGNEVDVHYLLDLELQWTNLDYDETYEELCIYSPGWLPGWDNRVKMVIDHNDIDSNLTDFPVLLYLSDSSGINFDDVSFIFDELQNDSNRKKIGITLADKVTQCYVEIEKWDDANEQAWLWVKVPDVSSTVDTVLYLYYDADHADNTAYVGDPDTAPAEKVWDNNYIGIWHMGESTGGTDAIKDSTLNDNHGTDSGAPTLGYTGKIGDSIHFDGVNDHIVVPDDTSLQLGSGLTIEAWINVDVWGNWEDIVFKGGGGASNSDYQFALVSSGFVWDGTYSGTWRTKYFNTPQDTGTWIYAVLSHDTDTVKCYRNGTEISSQADVGAIYESTYQLGISREGAASSGYLDGTIDEVRISNITRNSTWIKANYESERDHLIYFDKEETLQSASFNASGGYMLIGDGTPDWGSSYGTISFWVKWDTLTNRPWGQHNNMETRISGTNLVVDWGADSSVTSTTSFTVGNWYFIAITWNEATNITRLYVGDQNHAPALNAENLVWTSVVSTVGVTQNNFMASKGGVEPLDGQGDELRYWNVDRSLAEIIRDYNNEISGSETNLVSYYKLNEDFYDSSPNNNHGSGSGSYSFSSSIPFVTRETIMVDVWFNSMWNNVITGLSPGWHNVSVNAYLDTSTFTIRLRGSNELQDKVQDIWQIDAALLHLWSTHYTTEVEFEGTSNFFNWDQIQWLTNMSFSSESINVTIQLYNHDASSYPSTGEGYFSYISGAADFKEQKSQLIVNSPEHYRNGTGWWKLRIVGDKVTSTQYDMNVDLVSLLTTYYSEYSAETEFIFTDITDNQSPNLNFTVVTHNSIENATVTIQVWNYTVSSYAMDEQGYLSYTSTGSNVLHWLNVTSNAQTCLNIPEARIRVTSVYATTDSFQQITNLVRLQQEESLQLHDYALRVTNNGASAYQVRLSRVSSSNVARLINCTIYFRSGEHQIQVIDGAFTQFVGTWATIPAASSLDLLIEASSIGQESVSVIDAELTAMEQGTSTYTKLPVQITIH